MDIEKLTKQQIVLVTLLVSFVTSIATGIVTVALMDQAPAGVTQTINRVVERTIEKVVTEPAKNPETIITRETIVVKEDDKIVESVAKNKNSIVRIYVKGEDNKQGVFIGLGTIVSKDGLIVTGDVFADPKGSFMVITDDNKTYDVTVLPKKEENRFYFLKIQKTDDNDIVFSPVTLSDSDSLKLGQTVIAWGGQTQNTVFTGIVSSLIDNGSQVFDTTSTSTNTVKEILAINTNINPTDSLSGGPLLNLYGEVIGLRVSNNISTQHYFLPSNLLQREAGMMSDF
jgi:S1-C subfamily serine protease